MAFVVVKYLHMIGIMVLLASLVSEHFLIKSRMTPAEMGKVARMDIVYGISAIIVLLTGMALWFHVGKGADFFSPNLLLHAKVGIFALAALISIYPTVFFIKQRRSVEPSMVIPKAIVMCVRIELLLLLLVPLFAVLVVQGYGLS